MVRGMDNSIICQSGQNMARFPGKLGKCIEEEKEVKKAVGDQDKQDNALKHQRSCSPSVPVLFTVIVNTVDNVPPFASSTRLKMPTVAAMDRCVLFSWPLQEIRQR